jgi:two-component system cell cycle sensor histidine kinase/response regulator CckA
MSAGSRRSAPACTDVLVSDASTTVPTLKRATRLTFAGALVALLVGGLWFYESERQRQQSAAEANLEAIAKLKVDEIVRWRAERLGDGSVIMAHFLPAEVLARLLTAKERGAPHPSLLAQLRALQRAYGYEDILLADTSGSVRLSLSDAVGKLHDEAVRAIDEAIRTRRPVLTDIHVGPADRPAHIDVVAPIWVGEHEQAAGAVVLRSDAQTFLYPLIQTWPVPSASAETLLVRREGATVLFLNPLRYRKDAALTLRLPLSREDVPAAMAARGQQGYVRGTDYRGVAVFAYVMPVPDTRWLIVAKMDASEVESHWRLRSMLIAGLVLGLGAWIVTLLLAISQRARAVHYASLVAAREQAEQTLRATSSRQEAILAAVPDIIMEVDNSKVYTWANRAGIEFFGEDVIGREAADYFIGEQDTYGVVRPIFEGAENVLYVESWQRRRDGEKRLLAWWCRVLKDGSGNVTGALSTARDVTERRVAEERAETLTRSIDVHPDGAYWLDTEGRFVYVNDAACRALGYEREQLLRMNVFDVNPKATPERMQRVWELLRQEGHFFTESTHRRSDGSEFPVEIATAYVRSGGQEYACGFARDISERKQAEAALRKSEAQLSAALKLARLGHWEYDVAKDLFTFNDHFYALFRTTAEREGGYEMSSERYARRFCHPDDMAMVGLEIGEALETNDPNYTADVTHRVIFGDGEIGYITVRIFIVKDSQGRTVRTYGVNQDVTERMRDIEALRVSEERFRTVFEAVADGTVLADTETGRFVLVNQALCRMLGYTQEELLRLAVDDIHLPADLPMVKEAFQRQLSGEQPLATGIPVLRKDGTTFIADIHGLPLTLGDARCVLGVFRDMTAFNEMEQQLRQAQKMEAVGQLAGGVAHDFNNILCVIQGHCDLVLRSLREDDPLFKSIAQIQSSGERAAALTRQLLAFSRKQALQPEVLDLNATVRNLEGMLRRLIGEDIDFTTRLAASLGRVKADPGQVEQVVVNLAVNARDAMPRGGRLLIETANVELTEEHGGSHADVAPGQYVMLVITDTGSGMDQRTMERVFEPFFTTKEKGKGTGLGLATVYGIVKQSGGAIRVASELGRGATFRVYLPRCDDAVAAKAAGAPAASPRGAGEHILLVEDETALGEVVRDVLTTLGYRVTLAANAGEALLAVEERCLAPDLVVTDIVMPGMSGAMLAKRLRRTQPDLKVLFMSGYADDGITHSGVLEPGTPFIQKPFKIDDFAAKVALALGGPKPSQ